MAGGNWTTQNKVLPGVYTNFTAKLSNNDTGVNGTVGLAALLPWLPEHKITKVYPEDIKNLVADFGELALTVQEALKNATSVLLFRLNTGTVATVTVGNLICTAKYSGTFGNKLTVSISNVVGEVGSFYVTTFIGTDEVDRQKVTDASGIVNNDWIKFTSGENKALTVTAGAKLIDGQNGTVTNSDYAAFLSALEIESFGGLACTSNDTDVKAMFVAFTKRLINDEGRYFQTVIPECTANFEGIISIQNGVILTDGIAIDKVKAAAYIAGATAAAPASTSLTNAVYKGAIDVDTRYTTKQQEDFAKSGQMIFIADEKNNVYIQKDINTLTTFTDIKTYAFSKNKIIRTLFAMANKIKDMSNKSFIGKVPNTEDGRALFKAAILEYFRVLQAQSILKDIVPDDVIVRIGTQLDTIEIDYVVRPADTIDIIYNTIAVDS